MRRAGLSPVPLPPGRKPAISGIAAARTGHRRRDAPADPAFVGVLQLAHVDAGRHRRLHVRCRHRLRRSGGPPPAQDRRATAPLAARRVARHSTETEPGDAGRSVDAAATETRYLDTLLAFVDDEALSAAYALSDGLCVPHLVQAVALETEGADALVTRTRQAW